MTNLLAALSSELGAAAATASAAIVQVQTRRRPVAGIVFAADHVLTLGHDLDDETTAVRRADGRAFEGTVLGRHAATGLAVVHAKGLDVPVASPGDEPSPGHLALAVGRTWSGGVFSALAPVSVVGGPLRTGRSSEVARVVRVGLAPHGALTGGALVDGAGHVLGVITAFAIRGTTVVIPATIAWAAAHDIVSHGDARQGFVGVSSLPVTLPVRQQTDGRSRGLLVTGVVADGPADAAGVLVGDVIVGLAGEAVADPDDLLTVLRRHQIGQTIDLSVVRGTVAQGVSVTIAERRRE